MPERASDLPESVSIVEVGPRDGLQSLERNYPVETKVAMVEILADAGYPVIEVSGFVRPEIIPQLADAGEVFAQIKRREGTVYRALVPNRRGAERAVAADADELLALITASDTYNQKNSNMSVADNLDQIDAIADLAHETGKSIVAAIGVCMFCPYEGEIPETRVLEMIERMRGAGIDSVYLATSTGLDGPGKVGRLTGMILDRWPDLRLGLHMHNTNGMALANALIAMQNGVAFLEGSACGIGGGIRMPGGMAHFGNIATEDLVHLCTELGVDGGVDLESALDAATRVKELLELDESFSSALSGGTKQAVLEQARKSPADSGH
jgi:hydroxymethylglutaryl-CoA lyase